MSGGAVVASLVSSAFWLACGSDDASATPCSGDACVVEAGPSDTSDDAQIVPDGCDLTKDPKDSAACVDDTIGLFVSAAGSDANPGTKSAPLKTIGAAVGKTDSQHTRVYVCAGAYGENVKVATGNKTAGIYGGFSCSDWSYAGGAPNAIVTSNGGYALEVNTLNTTLTVEDVELDSPDATNPGDSSIAVFITTSTGVILKRVNAKAGKGADGADAVPASNWDGGAAPTGNSPDASTGDLGGDPCVNKCGDGTEPTGGKGGNGGFGVTPGSGGNGTPVNTPTGTGVDGMGGVFGSVVAGTCANGHPGPKGADADGGAAGSGTAGAVDANGWHLAIGASGASGTAGQGAGGGSGGLDPDGTTHLGGGGGGGCGGCGGAGGVAGAGGGSSITLLVYQSTLTLQDATLGSGAGGNGKNGGTGQAGQGGGSRGNAAADGCNGGAGGPGGNGAGGGGGAAGNSIALGYLVTAPTVQSSTFTKGSAGTPGGGGTGAAGNNGLAGADGISAEQQDLKP